MLGDDGRPGRDRQREQPGSEPEGFIGADGELVPKVKPATDVWPVADKTSTTPRPWTRVRPGVRPRATPRPRWTPPPDALPEGRSESRLKRHRGKLLVLMVTLPIMAVIGLVQHHAESNTAGQLTDLPGVVSVDQDEQRVQLAPEVTKAQARAVLDQVFGLRPGWELSIGTTTMEIIKRGSYRDSADLHPPLDVLLLIGPAALPGIESIQLSLQSIPNVSPFAEVRTDADVIPATRALLDTLSASKVSGTVGPGYVSSGTATIYFEQPSEATESVLTAVAELPRFESVELGPPTTVVLRSDQPGADRTCRTASRILAAHDVRARLMIKIGDGADQNERPC